MAFLLPRFKKCCCCIPLRIGSLIIGYVSIVFAALSLAVVSVSLWKVVEFVKYVKTDNSTLPPEHTPEDVAKTAVGLYVSHAYFLLVFLYYLVISILLVVGVHLNKPNLMRYYFNFGLFLLILATVLVIVTAVFMGFIATVPLLKWCMTLFFCLVIVRSSYMEMEESKKPPTVIEMSPYYNPQQAPLIT